MTSMPKINAYQFGKMIINNKPVTSDLMILPSGELIPDWRRKQGHFLGLDDIKIIKDACPDLIVIGTGISGQMRIDPHLINHFKQKNIHLYTCPTGEAVEFFNEKRGLDKTIAACFHLTC